MQNCFSSYFKQKISRLYYIKYEHLVYSDDDAHNNFMRFDMQIIKYL